MCPNFWLVIWQHVIHIFSSLILFIFDSHLDLKTAAQCLSCWEARQAVHPGWQNYTKSFSITHSTINLLNQTTYYLNTTEFKHPWYTWKVAVNVCSFVLHKEQRFAVILCKCQLQLIPIVRSLYTDFFLNHV